MKKLPKVIRMVLLKKKKRNEDPQINFSQKLSNRKCWSLKNI